MTDGTAGARARRQRTWSRLGNLGQVPTEYEIVTHGMNYTTSFPTTLEAGPHTFGNRWIAEHRDAVAVRVDSWDDFRDPDELTYWKYNERQDAAETFVDQVLAPQRRRRAPRGPRRRRSRRDRAGGPGSPPGASRGLAGGRLGQVSLSVSRL